MYFTSRPSRAEMGERARRRRGITDNARSAEQARIDERRRQLESISAKGIRDAETAPLESAQAEFEQLYRTLAENQQATIFVAPDPYGVFEPLPPGYDHANAQTIKDHDQLNFEMFEKARPQYFDCRANVDTMRRYFAANGHKDRFTARTFISAYDRLNALGHMLTAEQIVHNAQQAELPPSAPVPTYTLGDGRQLTRQIIEEMDPSQYRRYLNGDPAFRDASEYLLGGTAPSQQVAPPAPAPVAGEWGWDPITGEKKFLSNKIVDAMGPDEYKRFSRGSVQQNPYVFRGQK